MAIGWMQRFLSHGGNAWMDKCLLNFMHISEYVEFEANTEIYSEPCQTSKTKHFVKIVNGFQPLNVFVKCPILDV